MAIHDAIENEIQALEQQIASLEASLQQLPALADALWSRSVMGKEAVSAGKPASRSKKFVKCKPPMIALYGDFDRNPFIDIAREWGWGLVDLEITREAVPEDPVPAGAIVADLPTHPVVQKLRKIGCPIVRLGRQPHPDDEGSAVLLLDDAAATVVLFFNTNGNPVVFNSTNVQVVAGVTVSTGDWVRVTVYTDYTTKKWDFYIDGAPVASGLDFYDAANTRYEKLQFSGGGPTGAFLDDITVGTISPFAGLPLFTVISAHGLPSPAVGTWSYELDTAINAYMPGAIITDDLIRYVCTGWIGTGSGLTSGADTNITFTITEDTTITWQWQTNFWVDFTIIGE